MHHHEESHPTAGYLDTPPPRPVGHPAQAIGRELMREPGAFAARAVPVPCPEHLRHLCRQVLGGLAPQQVLETGQRQ